MSSAYLRFLKRHLPCFSFTVDSGWSWVLSIVAFVYLIVAIGIVHSLGVFFAPWMEEYQASEATLIWVQSAYYGCNMLCGPIVILTTKIIPGQILLIVGGLSNCAVFIIAAFLGKPVFARIYVKSCHVLFVISMVVCVCVCGCVCMCVNVCARMSMCLF